MDPLEQAYIVLWVVVWGVVFLGGSRLRERWLRMKGLRARLEVLTPEKFGVDRDELVELAKVSMEAFAKRATPAMVESLEEAHTRVERLYFRAVTKSVVEGLRLRVLDGQHDLFRPIVETVARETVWSGKPRREYGDALSLGAMALVRQKLGLPHLEEAPADEPDPAIVERDKKRLEEHRAELAESGHVISEETHEGGPDIIAKMMAKAAEDHRKKLEESS